MAAAAAADDDGDEVRRRWGASATAGLIHDARLAQMARASHAETVDTGGMFSLGPAHSRETRRLLDIARQVASHGGKHHSYVAGGHTGDVFSAHKVGYDTPSTAEVVIRPHFVRELQRMYNTTPYVRACARALLNRMRVDRVEMRVADKTARVPPGVDVDLQKYGRALVERGNEMAFILGLVVFVTVANSRMPGALTPIVPDLSSFYLTQTLVGSEWVYTVYRLVGGSWGIRPPGGGGGGDTSCGFFGGGMYRIDHTAHVCNPFGYAPDAEGNPTSPMAALYMRIRYMREAWELSRQANRAGARALYAVHYAGSTAAGAGAHRVPSGFSAMDIASTMQRRGYARPFSAGRVNAMFGDGNTMFSSSGAGADDADDMQHIVMMMADSSSRTSEALAHSMVDLYSGRGYVDVPPERTVARLDTVVRAPERVLETELELQRIISAEFGVPRFMIILESQKRTADDAQAVITFNLRVETARTAWERIITMLWMYCQGQLLLSNYEEMRARAGDILAGRVPAGGARRRSRRRRRGVDGTVSLMAEFRRADTKTLDDLFADVAHIVDEVPSTPTPGDEEAGTPSGNADSGAAAAAAAAPAEDVVLPEDLVFFSMEAVMRSMEQLTSDAERITLAFAEPSVYMLPHSAEERRELDPHSAPGKRQRSVDDEVSGEVERSEERAPKRARSVE